MGTKLRLARFTLETMDIWQIIVFVVLAALVVAWVAIIAYNKGRVSGRVSAEQAAASDETALCLFGDDVPVRPTERRLVEVLPEALIVTTVMVECNMPAPVRCRLAWFPATGSTLAKWKIF